MNAIIVSGANAVSIALSSDALTQRQNVLDDSRAVRVVSDSFGQSSAVEALRGVKGLLKSVEEARKEVKEPVIALGRRIDAMAKEFGTELERESVRLSGLLTAYETEQRRIAVEAEAKRRAEEQPTAERVAAAQAVGDARAEIQAKLEAAAAMTPAAAPERVEGQRVTETWTFDVVDLAALAKSNPDLVTITPKRADILALIRSGTREIPGLTIRKEIKVGVKA